MRRYKTTGNTTLFDKEEKKRKFSEMGDPPERLSQVIDFEMFRPELEDALVPKERKSNAGAKRYDVVMMFKLMVLQRYYNLSDEQTEYQIVERTSFRRFLGLVDGDRVPEARTIWLFRERLVRSGKVGDLFQRFVDYLNGKGLIFNEGRVVDASFVSVPRQRNTPDENKRIKAGEGEGLWNPEEGGQRGGHEAQGQQEMPQGHGRTLDAKRRGEPLRLQEQRQGRHEEQADTGAGGHARLGSRLPADGHAA